MHSKDVQCNTMELPSPFHSQDLMSNSPCCLSYSSYDDSSENFVLDQLLTPWLISFFILINCLLDKVLILKGEILSWSLVEFRGVTVNLPDQIGLCFEAKHVHCCRPEFDRKHWSVGACIPAEGRQCLSPLGL